MLIQSEILGIPSRSGLLILSRFPRIPTPLRNGMLAPSQLPVSLRTGVGC